MIKNSITPLQSGQLNGCQDNLDTCNSKNQWHLISSTYFSIFLLEFTKNTILSFFLLPGNTIAT